MKRSEEHKFSVISVQMKQLHSIPSSSTQPTKQVKKGPKTTMLLNDGSHPNTHTHTHITYHLWQWNPASKPKRSTSISEKRATTAFDPKVRNGEREWVYR